MSQEKALAQERGMKLNAPDTMGVVLVRADIANVSSILAEMLDGMLLTDVYGQDCPDDLYSDLAVVFQLRAHSWTLFSRYMKSEDFLLSLSERLQTTCLYYAYEDTSGWCECMLFQAGQRLEKYQAGYSYRDELETLEEEFGEEFADALDGFSGRDGEAYLCDIDVTDENENRTIFQSHQRTVTETEVQADGFLDAWFRSQDAWLPDLDYFPYDGKKYQALSAQREDFVRVDVIRRK